MKTDFTSILAGQGKTDAALIDYSGYMFIHTETRNFQAGQVVEGLIALYVTRPVSVRILYLKFKGVEQGMWSPERSGFRETLNRTHVHHQSTGRGYVISQRFPVFTFSQCLVPGQYGFPFKFTLPADIPGSFYLAYGNVYAGISYRLIATTLCDAEEEVEKHSLLIHVNQLMTNPIYSAMGSEIVYQPSGCCSEQAVMELKVTFLKRAYAPGELIDFVIEVNNLALTSAIINFEATMYRTIRITSNHRDSFTERETMSIVIKQQQIPPASDFTGRSTVAMSMLVDGYYDDIYHAVSVHSRYIDCAYSICVKALTEKTGLEPEIESHFQINPVQLPLMQPRANHEQWSPVMMPEAQFQPGEEYHYEPSTQIDHKTRINIA